MNNYIFCDIDGTIADNEHRVYLIKRKKELKDWNTFNKLCEFDIPIHSTINFLATCMREIKNCKIVYLTGRTDNTEMATRTWLKRHMADFDGYELIMRRSGDRRTAYDLKTQEVRDYIFFRDIEPEVNFMMYIDNDPNIIKGFSELGYLTKLILGEEIKK